MADLMTYSERRRAELITASKTARAMIETRADSVLWLGDAPTINQVLINCIYPVGEYHTFADWVKRGKSVISGSRGYPVWGRKQRLHVVPGDGEADEFAGFDVVYLFHDSQVEDALARELRHG